MDDTGAVHLTRHNGEVIITSGYRIGPYDVESVLLEHDAVDEVAVYGIPDPLRGALVQPTSSSPRTPPPATNSPRSSNASSLNGSQKPRPPTR